MPTTNTRTATATRRTRTQTIGRQMAATVGRARRMRRVSASTRGWPYEKFVRFMARAQKGHDSRPIRGWYETTIKQTGPRKFTMFYVGKPIFSVTPAGWTLDVGGNRHAAVRKRLNAFTPASVVMTNGLWHLDFPEGAHRKSIEFLDGVTVNELGRPIDLPMDTPAVTPVAAMSEAAHKPFLSASEMLDIIRNVKLGIPDSRVSAAEMLTGASV